MKTENMKLLDLQTGKYLELGKEWLYGGKWIILMSCHRKHYTTIDEYFIESNSINITNTRWLKTEPQGKLKTLCDKTGAVVYGDRYVLLSDYRSGCGYYSGDVFLIEDRFYSIAGHYFLYKGTFNQDQLGDWVHTFVCNLFEEYSKQLRKEENKFDELMEKLK
jgi:hypothetical protein